jgi:hypothetical protein
MLSNMRAYRTDEEGAIEINQGPVVKTIDDPVLVEIPERHRRGSKWGSKGDAEWPRASSAEGKIIRSGCSL